jgi:hypothetical protein
MKATASLVIVTIEATEEIVSLTNKFIPATI